jgi:hypothetical protein
MTTEEQGERLYTQAELDAAVEAAVDAAAASRTLIGQAQGLLMALRDIDADEAFDALKAVSRTHNIKLAQVVRSFIEIRELPAPLAPRKDRQPDGRLDTRHAGHPEVIADTHFFQCTCGWRSAAHPEPVAARRQFGRHRAAVRPRKRRKPKPQPESATP